MKRFKALLVMMVMALAVITWAGWSPATASNETDDTAIEETLNQDEEAVQEDEAYGENLEEGSDSQELPDAETQEEPSETN